ncbi:hypothetical protein DERF_016717 [Dermatophagoides farinae]|uniref:Uncharacterized protein n=1 Tax=Dermatophagoides farinae TaxID=6954 RepID=A0A922HK80_DERFA|nr:hypothetical protein DERF_016717 [Dermatophagoides farinae]
MKESKKKCITTTKNEKAYLLIISNLSSFVHFLNKSDGRFAGPPTLTQPPPPPPPPPSSKSNFFHLAH